MNKNFMKGMAALCICAAFTSCSKDVFDANFEDKQKDASYEEAFIKQFGPISPTQNWDFTKTSTVTRADGETPLAEIAQFPPFGNDGYGTGDFKWLWESGDASRGVLNNGTLTKLLKSTPKSNIVDFSGIQESTWNPSKYKNLYFRVYAMTGDNQSSSYKQIGVYLPGKKNYWLVQGNPSGTYWSNGNNYMSRPRGIDFSNLPEGTSWFMISHATADESIKASDYALTTFKEKTYTLDGEVYTFWGFDTTDNGNIDLILWVEAEKKDIERVTAKRYMCEDLGGDGDIDFNDIVFDIVENSDGQTCTVRALGGTLDIAILVGDKQYWRKSEDPNFVTKQMYNTGYQGSPINYHDNLAVFRVNDWDENENNVSIAVYQDDSKTEAMKLIKFPIMGSVPRMIAVDTRKYWQLEQVKIKNMSWFEQLDEE